jgi:hypothetical protein
MRDDSCINVHLLNGTKNNNYDFQTKYYLQPVQEELMCLEI